MEFGFTVVGNSAINRDKSERKKIVMAHLHLDPEDFGRLQV